MKIDLHCHTRKIKQGDSEKREVDFDLFEKKVQEAQVSIVAITNHNFFDYKQYIKFSSSKNVQVWPGIELDIKGTKGKSHCVMVVNPENVEVFKEICDSKINNKDHESFEITIDDLINYFDSIDAIYIAHYNKKPSIHEVDLQYFHSKLEHKMGLFLEPGTLKSAGIMIAHGYNTLIGSDVSDWNLYEKYEIPELKLPIDSFNKFKLLLKKDPEVIKTFRNQKYHEQITVQPFKDFQLSLEIYNDVNIIFGGKGTGKTETLKKIEEHYKSKGNNDVATYYGSDKKKDYSEISSVSIEDNDIDHLNLSEEKLRLSEITDWKDTTITSIKEYVDWKKSVLSSTSRKNFGFIDAIFSEMLSIEEFDEIYYKFNDIKAGFENINQYEIEKYVPKQFDSYMEIVSKIIFGVKQEAVDSFCRYYALTLEQFTIQKMKAIYTSKKAEKTKPAESGFSTFFSNHYLVYKKAKEVNEILEMKSKFKKITIGFLPDKGKIYLEKSISLNPDLFDRYSKFKLGNGVLTKLREIKTCFQDLEKKALTKDINSTIASLKDKLKEYGISNMKDFLGVKGTVKKEDGVEYSPSNGEQSMLLLNNALLDDKKNIFILDEPELSVGHSYINDVILPRIRDLSRANKKVIISTHDANLGVRSLPFQSLFRVDLGSNKYQTFIGNPFQDILTDVNDSTKILKWSNVALKTLEGGKEAFLERDVIYGKEKY